MGSLLLSLLLSAAYGSTLVEDVQKQLSRRPAVSGTFKQTRFVKQMAVTLNSSGKFQLDKKSGLSWNQIEPFEYNFKVNRERIELVTKGSKPEIVTKESQPLLFAFSQTFLSLFSGDMAALNKQFDVKSSGTNQKWKFEFAPRDDAARKAVKVINVVGGVSIDQVLVEDTQGNKMQVDFVLAKGTP